MIAPADIAHHALTLAAMMIRSGSPCATLEDIGRIDLMLFGVEMLTKRLDPACPALDHFKLADAVLDGATEAALEDWRTPSEIRADLEALAATLEAAAREASR